MVSINYREVHRLIGEIARYRGLTGYIPRLDKQFWAIHELIDRINDNVLVLAVTGNSLVSYRLSKTGEEYWWVFHEELLRSKPGLNELLPWFKNFLVKHNNLAYNSKIKRLEKYFNSHIARRLRLEPWIYCGELSRLHVELTRLYSDPLSKTVAFTVKMYHYTCLAKGFEHPIELYIPIPVDKRIASRTCREGLLNGVDEVECIDRAMRDLRDLVVKTWWLISRYTGIPTIYIDTLMWINKY